MQIRQARLRAGLVQIRQVFFFEIMNIKITCAHKLKIRHAGEKKEIKRMKDSCDTGLVQIRRVNSF